MTSFRIIGSKEELFMFLSFIFTGFKLMFGLLMVFGSEC